MRATYIFYEINSWTFRLKNRQNRSSEILFEYFFIFEKWFFNTITISQWFIEIFAYEFVCSFFGTLGPTEMVALLRIEFAEQKSQIVHDNFCIIKIQTNIYRWNIWIYWRWVICRLYCLSHRSMLTARNLWHANGNCNRFEAQTDLAPYPRAKVSTKWFFISIYKSEKNSYVVQEWNMARQLLRVGVECRSNVPEIYSDIHRPQGV